MHPPTPPMTNSSVLTSPSLHVNGIGIAKQNGFGIGNGHHHIGSPMSIVSSTSSTSTSAMSHQSISSNASRSPRFSPRNPVLGIGCVDTDTFRRARKLERGRYGAVEP
jgi:hypothetical protein